MPPPTTIHFCERQRNVSRNACCQFVLLLNDTDKYSLSFVNYYSLIFGNIDLRMGCVKIALHFRIPFCPVEDMRDSINESIAVLPYGINGTSMPTRQTFYTTPLYLRFPAEDVPEDHVTFLFGILLLVSIAVICTALILKLTKPTISMPSAVPFANALDYDLMMFLPSHRRRRSSVLLYCRSTCRTRRPRNTSLSISYSISILPSYRAAATATTATSPTSLPPPAYEELQALTSVASEPRRIDRNNNAEWRRIR
jgi:hypothetical protein